MLLNKIKDDMKLFGLVNSLIYIILSLILLPVVHILNRKHITKLHYILYYTWFIGTTIYCLISIIKVNKYKYEDSNIKLNAADKVTYNWFIKGGFKSYQDIFVLSEVKPLIEYGLLFSIILLPLGKSITTIKKLSGILYKIAVFHITSSLMLIDWKTLVVDYSWKNIDKNTNSIKVE